MDRYKMGSRMTDKDHKEQGNKFFNANKFDSAVESYSKAGKAAIFLLYSNKIINIPVLIYANYFWIQIRIQFSDPSWIN